MEGISSVSIEFEMKVSDSLNSCGMICVEIEDFSLTD